MRMLIQFCFRFFPAAISTNESSEKSPSSKLPVPILDLSGFNDDKDENKTKENNSTKGGVKPTLKQNDDKDVDPGTKNISTVLKQDIRGELGEVVNAKTKLNNNAKSGQVKTNVHRTEQEKKLLERRSRTQTTIVQKRTSKIPVRAKSGKTFNGSKDFNESTAKDSEIQERSDDLFKAKIKARRLVSLNEKLKNEKDFGSANEAKGAWKSRTALLYDREVRSSGYGAPVHPNLRPVALKPRSATTTQFASRQRSQRSATSMRSIKLDKSLEASRKENGPTTVSQPDVKRELVPVMEEQSKKDRTKISGKVQTQGSIENEDPTTRRSSKRNEAPNRSELAKINEVPREESITSEVLDQSELQSRLSSIKKKVEVRKRRGDSRSSFGSDLDISFQDRYFTSPTTY